MEVKEALATGQDVTVKSDGSAELAGVSLPGLPEGVLVVGYQSATNDDCKQFSNGEIRILPKGFTGLLINPSPGYEFYYQAIYGRYQVRKLYDKPKRLAVHFLAKNSAEEDSIRALDGHPAYSGISD